MKNTKFHRCARQSFLLFSLAALPLSADAEIVDAVVPAQEFIAVGSRPSNPEAEAAAFTIRAEEAEATATVLPQIDQEITDPLSSILAIPTAYHQLSSVGGASKHRTIQLEDGSHFEVIESDAWITDKWQYGDVLEISGNYSWFSQGDYYITNRNTGTYVRADLTVGPIMYGPYSKWILQIDPIRGLLTLQDGSLWHIRAQDAASFSNWLPNDPIILGKYTSFFSSYNFILINVSTNSHVVARLY